MHEHNTKQTIEFEEVSCEVCLKNIMAYKALSEKTADNIAYFCGLDCYEKWKYDNLYEDQNYNIDFLDGIYCLFSFRYKEARSFFLTAVTVTSTFEIHHDIYLSYLGLSNVLIDYKNGILDHCHHSFDVSSLSAEPEIQLNHACAEFIKGNRRHAVQVMDKLNGLKLSSNNLEEIHSLFNIVGKRRNDDNGLPKRDTFFYKSVGKLLRKKEKFAVKDIEAFIINTAKERYKGAILNQLH